MRPRVVLLDAADPRGYVRRWQPPGVNPATHWSYAIQWWCFAAVLLILYVALNLRKIER
jgi:surfeit locus 1 family protein